MPLIQHLIIISTGLHIMDRALGQFYSNIFPVDMPSKFNKPFLLDVD